MSGIIVGLLPIIDSILGVRDDIGAALKAVSIVTRTWSGAELGEGTSGSTHINVLPSPRIVEFKADSRVFEGGVVKSGDILLKNISKNAFPLTSDIDCSVTLENVEKYYVVGGINFQVIGFQEKYLTWNVHLRRRTSQD